MMRRSSVFRASRTPVEELERHLMRCRRRDERASVLTARLRSTDGPAPQQLVACFRLTDSVWIRQTPHGYDVSGVFDDDGFDRGALEQRLRAMVRGADTRLGWARFPDDGVTLAALLDCAARASTGGAVVG
jgi:hypothetical protein